MSRFHYEAVGQDRKTVHGAIEAPSRDAAVDRLLARGETPLSVRATDAFDTPSALTPWRSTWRPRALHQVVSSLAALTRAGIPVERALRLTAEGMPGSTGTKALTSLADRVRAGDGIAGAAAAITPPFPAEVCALLDAAEQAGALPATLARLTETLKERLDLQEKFQSALAYPAAVALSMAGSLAFLIAFVLPQLRSMFSANHEALPTATRFLLDAGAFIEANASSLAILCAAAIAGCAAFLRSDMGRRWIGAAALSPAFALGLPFKRQAAGFLSTLAMLLSGGVPLARCVEIAGASSANPIMRERLAVVSTAVRGGERLSAALKAGGLVPPFAIDMLVIGEETGRLSDMAGEAARTLGEQTRSTLERLGALALPIMTLLLGLIVGGVMYAVVSGLLAANTLAIG